MIYQVNQQFCYYSGIARTCNYKYSPMSSVNLAISILVLFTIKRDTNERDGYINEPVLRLACWSSGFPVARPLSFNTLVWIFYLYTIKIKLSFICHSIRFGVNKFSPWRFLDIANLNQDFALFEKKHKRWLKITSVQVY